MSQPGAPAALHGYYVQALYTIARVLEAGSNDREFRPEFQEDLAIYSSDGKCLEIIQVKKYSLLQLSHLDPDSPNSFLRRALTHLSVNPGTQITLANYGEFGPELHSSWTSGLAGNPIAKKLISHGYSESEINLLSESIQLSARSESDDKNGLLERLRELFVGNDSTNSLKFLLNWIQEAMRRQKTIRFEDIGKALNEVGKWISDRSGFYNHFHTTIKPLVVDESRHRDYESLRKEMYEGSFTRYEHIIENLDIRRETKVEEIRLSFERSNIVVIHAASGQGKTTIAYRYMHDYFPDGWRFTVNQLADLPHAIEAAESLSEYAAAARVPIAVYLDVGPSNANWFDFCQRLSRHPYIHLLVTIREEDFRRNILPADFRYEEIDLNFTEEEARGIFAEARNVTDSILHLNFEAAWGTFDKSGPLLEFMFHVTQTDTLRKRLSEQVQRLENDVREGRFNRSEMKLLRLVSIAAAFDARVRTRSLLEYLSLAEPAATVRRLENEYLIRCSDNGYIEGLHVIRSRILSDLLVDPDYCPWVDLAREVLPMVVEEDLESFLLGAAYSHRSDFHDVRIELRKLNLSTWSGLAGVLRALLWDDIKNYVDSSKGAIEEARKAMGKAWYFVTLPQPVTEDLPNVDRWWASDLMKSLVPPDRSEKLDAIGEMLPARDGIFRETQKWLSLTSFPAHPPDRIQDWRGVAFVSYWAARLEVQGLVIPTANTTLPLAVLAEYAFAMYKYSQSQYSVWLDLAKPDILLRLSNELSVVSVDIQESHLQIHFLLPGVRANVADRDTLPHENHSNNMHDATMDRLNIVRQLFPYCETYGSQGYMFGIGDDRPLGFDDTKKQAINRENLVPPLVYWANTLAHNLANLDLRLGTWDTYLSEIVAVRREVADRLEKIQGAVVRYIQSRIPIPILGDELADDLKVTLGRLSDCPGLPQCAVDPFGFTSEIQAYSGIQQASSEMNSQGPSLSRSMAYAAYRKYLKALSRYTSSIASFINQMPHVGLYNLHMGRESSPLLREEMEKTLRTRGPRSEFVRLSVINLRDAQERLYVLQREYRELFAHVQMRGDRDLESIESLEAEVLDPTFFLWLHYAYYPGHRFENPIRDVAHNLNVKKAEIDRIIRKALSNFRGKSRCATRLTPIDFWPEKNVLVLQMDIGTSLDLFASFSDLVIILKESLGFKMGNDPRFYLARDMYQSTIIVPTVKGRRLGDFGWHLNSDLTILNPIPVDRQSWAVYASRQLSSDWTSQLRLGRWQSEFIDKASEVLGAVASLRFLSTQLAELATLPEIDDANLDAVKSIIDLYSESVSSTLQLCYDGIRYFSDSWQALSTTEQRKRVHLHDAVSTLVQVKSRVTPSYQDENRQVISIKGFEDYSRQLLKVEEHVIGTWLLVVEDYVQFRELAL